MGTMLIVNAVLLLGIASESKLIIEGASSSATSDSPVVSTTTVAKRDLTTLGNQYRQRYNVPRSSTSGSYEDNSPAGTTVNTIPVPNPSQSVPHNPHQHYEESNQRQEPRGGPPIHAERSQPPGALPAFHGGFQVIPENGYPQNSATYAAQPSQRFQNKVANGGNQNPQFFATPSSYRYVTDNSRIGPPIKANSFPNSGGFPPFQNFKSAPITTGHYPGSFRDHSFEALPKFHFNPASSFNNHGSVGNSRQLSKSPYGGSPPFPASKNLEVTAPAFSPGLSRASIFKSFDKLGQNYQYGLPTVGYSGKITHPSPLQLQNSPEVAGLVPVFDNNFNYQTHPSAGPFSSAIGNYQSRILPVHSSSNAPLNSQYKASGSNAFGGNEFTKPIAGYQLLANQPQLHFTTHIPQKSGVDRPAVVYHTKPFEEIRTDVEVINKKKPTPPRPDDSDEHDFDEGYQTGSGGVGYFPESGLNKNPERDASFELPSSNLFDSYDETFGKHSKLSSREETTNDKVRPLVNQSSKPVYQSIEEEDDGNRDKSEEEYRGSYTDGEAANNSYEDEEEQESRRSERHESDDSSSREIEEDDDDDDDKRNLYEGYTEDFEKEFERGYRQELPKNEYVHVKEVPDIDETTSESKKRPETKSRPKTSRGGTREKSRRVVQNGHEEPKEYESYSTHVYEERPKSSYRDSEGRGSKTSYTTTSSSQPPTEQSYGEKLPRDRGTTKYAKKESPVTRIPKDETTKSAKSRSPPSRETNREPYIRDTNREPSSQQTNREPPIRQAIREPQGQQISYKSPRQTFSSTQRPLTLTLPTFESIESYTFPPFSSQKGGLKFARATDTYGAPTFGVQSVPNHETPNAGFKYIENGQFSRDFSGI